MRNYPAVSLGDPPGSTHVWYKVYPVRPGAWLVPLPMPACAGKIPLAADCELGSVGDTNEKYLPPAP